MCISVRGRSMSIQRAWKNSKENDGRRARRWGEGTSGKSDKGMVAHGTESYLAENTSKKNYGPQAKAPTLRDCAVTTEIWAPYVM